jgi:hypothetical protein
MANIQCVQTWRRHIGEGVYIDVRCKSHTIGGLLFCSKCWKELEWEETE